jgi:hypothetical protein
VSYTLTAGPQLLQSGATTGIGGILYLGGRCERLTVVLQGDGAAITTGAIVIEEAYFGNPSGAIADPAPAYGGTWSAIQTVTGTALTSGAQQIVHAQGSFWGVRARFSVAATSACSVWAWGN